MERIIVFCRSIRSGKTTELQQWLKGKTRVGGVLTPDENDLRVMENIRTGKRQALQSFTDSKDSISIGRFHFLSSGFEAAQDILLDELGRDNDWLVIDEVGKLEMEREIGLEPAVSKVIEHYQRPGEGRLLVVVRDFLLNDFMTHYTIFRCRVVTKLDEI